MFKSKTISRLKKETLMQVLICSIGVLAIVYLLVRIQFGLDLTDEAWINSSIVLGFNEGMPFGFSILWHGLTSIFHFNVLELRFFRLCISVFLILVLAYSLTSSDKKFTRVKFEEPSTKESFRAKITSFDFIVIAFFGILGIVLSYSYFPPYLGYNESVVLFTQLNLALLSYLIYLSNSRKKLTILAISLMSISTVATFIAKFSTGTLTFILIYLYLLSFVSKKFSTIYIAIVSIVFSGMYFAMAVYRDYINQVLLMVSDTVRAEHFGHSTSEILLDSIASLKSFVPIALICLLVYYVLTSRKSVRNSLSLSTGVILLGVFAIYLSTKVDLNAQEGFPRNYEFLRLFMITVFVSGIILVLAEFKLKSQSQIRDNSRRFFYPLCLVLVLGQPAGSNNEPWGILLCSAGTIFALISSLALKLKAQSVSLPNLGAIGATLVAGVMFMSVYSGINMPYRQPPVTKADSKFLSGPFEGIWVDPETLSKIENLNVQVQIAEEMGVTDLFALDTPILGVLKPTIIAQPIWLSQFWGITPDILAENCLSGFDSKRKFAIYLPNGEPDWPQLEDSLVLCGLSRNRASTDSIKLLEKPVFNGLPTMACSARLDISREHLGQGWWPSDATQFWSNKGFVHIVIPPMSSPGAVSIPYLKLNEDVDLRLVKNQPFQSIDYSSNTIKVVVQVVNEVTDVWLKISNARRPIDVLENNKDVRELGISIKEMQATC
jgi:hypothetical protein